MCVATKARLLAVKDKRAVVEIQGRERIVDIKPDLKLKRGDIVVIAFNAIIDKV